MSPSSVIFSLNAGGGFYSTVFYLCKAFLTAKRLRIPFFIHDSQWPYTHTSGWRDYFRTLEHPPVLPTHPCMRSPYRVAHNAQYNDPDFPLSDYVTVLQEIYKPHPQLMSRVAALLSQMGPSFVAVFVRRGDKLVEEAPFIPVRDIYATMKCDPSTPLFVQTDDYTVVEEFQAIHPPDKIVTIVPPTKRGQYHVRRLLNAASNPRAASIVPLLEQPKSQVRDETEEMIVGLEVCRAAPICWTDVTSNVGRFLKLMGRNVHVYPEDKSVDLSYRGCPAHEFI